MYSEPEPLSQNPEPEAVPLLQSSEPAPVSEWPPGGVEVMERYWIPLYRWAYRKVRDEHGATEIVEEVFLRHLRNPEKYPVQALWTLLRWETSHWRSRQKKHQALSMASAIDETEGPYDDGPDALESLIGSDEHEAILHAVHRLKQGDRDIITRYYLQQETIGEIAGALGIQPGTARVRLSRALKRLRGLIEGY
ncbi:RNA polymerase sigma factor [Longimicrobium sp.]|uniref:RNA polymerase sigma factor n=1 Tax=Longimicrobium sp. TaxID=2029185 RepID=UPI003B3ADBA2